MANRLLTAKEVSENILKIAKEVQKEFNLTDKEMVEILVLTFSGLNTGPMRM
jgi:hypothetical protein